MGRRKLTIRDGQRGRHTNRQADKMVYRGAMLVISKA